MTHRLVLASTSPQRRAILEQLAIPFDAVAPRYVEHDPPDRVRVESTAGPFPTTLVWEVAEHPEGSRAAFAVTGRPGGAMRLLQPLIARNTAKSLERSFPRLKEVLESR